MKLRSNKVYKLLLCKGDSSEIEDCGEDSDGDIIPLLRNATNIVEKDDEDISDEEIDLNDKLDKVSEKKNIKWKQEPLKSNIKFRLFINPDFVNIQKPLSPLEYFQNYIPEDFIQTITNMTNLYTVQNNLKYKFITSQEIKIFLGLQISMGCLKLPRRHMYWQNQYKIPLFVNSMSRDRFFQIRSNLHFVNKLEIPHDNKDKFFLVRPLFDRIKRVCNTLAVEEYVCVDEQMVPFTGRLSIKQYMKGKPYPWGVKIFALCGKSGLLYDFILYQGKETELAHNIFKKYGLGATIVLQFALNNLQKNGHCILFDNFFASYNLFEALSMMSLRAVGTLRINRFANPPLLSESKLKKKGRGASYEISDKKNTVGLVRWFDNKCVHLGSNFISTGEVSSVNRWNKKCKTHEEIEIPEIVKIYNNNMGGVDLFDQYISYYRVFIKSNKWTCRMIAHGFDMIITNCYLTYKRDCEILEIPIKEQMDYLNFRIMLSEELVHSQPSTLDKPKKRGRPSNEAKLLNLSESEPISKKRYSLEVRPSTSLRYDFINHLPKFDDIKEATRCKNCIKNRTHVYCVKCNVHLCFTKDRNCFFKFHDK